MVKGVFKLYIDNIASIAFIKGQGWEATTAALAMAREISSRSKAMHCWQVA